MHADRPKPSTTSGDMCAVCCGAYIDDVDETGEVTADWIQCTEEDCASRSHVGLLGKGGGGGCVFSLFKCVHLDLVTLCFIDKRLRIRLIIMVQSLEKMICSMSLPPTIRFCKQRTYG